MYLKPSILLIAQSVLTANHRGYVSYKGIEIDFYNKRDLNLIETVSFPSNKAPPVEANERHRPHTYQTTVQQIIRPPSNADKDHTAFLKPNKLRENGMKCRKTHIVQVGSTSKPRPCQDVTASNAFQPSFVARLIKHAQRTLRFPTSFLRPFRSRLLCFTMFSLRPS